MFEAIEHFRSKLDSGDVCLGAGITLADSSIVEAVAPSVDFVWIDLEHTHLSYETVQSHLIAARAGQIAALVRVRSSNVSDIKPILDIGAQGIIVPQVRSVEEVLRVVDATRYPPAGARGFGPRRASGYGRHGGPEWMAQVNRKVFVAVQIENCDALANLDAIAKVEGLDSLALGPHDLALAMGYDTDPQHAEVIAAMQRIVDAARHNRKYIGSGMGPLPDLAFKVAGMGVQWIQCGDDYNHMISRVDEVMDGLRKRLCHSNE